MPLSDVQISQIKEMKHDDLLRAAQTPDMGVLVEVAYRLHRVTKALNWVLVGLTASLVVLAVMEFVRFAPMLGGDH